MSSVCNFTHTTVHHTECCLLAPSPFPSLLHTKETPKWNYLESLLSIKSLILAVGGLYTNMTNPIEDKLNNNAEEEAPQAKPLLSNTN